ncbi:hypothetical protein [Aurantiacibacter poecillastricola]|uniref:hypothetical protein n=1 Tax=Aurantiacibacter poecillastricola TaxID=3064385 RepID=UPI00273EBD23|nr:hypothetical protein [Aurantiacibacter sp. 219JJ12-13]MDP5261882.1 hypothetical protein [Aurantiacibacter sp. 219JJ12-13]
MVQIRKPPVPVKMYKHFAVVTVAFTASIAMFADEDQRVAQQRSGEFSRKHEVEPNIPAYGRARLERSEGVAQGSFAEGDDGGDYGEPMVVPPGANVTSIAVERSPTTRTMLPNMTPEEVAALSEEEYQRLLALYVAAGAIEDVDRSAQQSEIEAASARRSGHGGSDS